MQAIYLYGPAFSYMVRAMRLLLNFKQCPHKVGYAPFDTPIEPFSEAHQQLHPFKKFPVYREGDLIIPETMAIAWYIQQKPGASFIPGSAAQQAQVLCAASLISQYVHQAIMSGILLEFRFPKGPNKTVRMDVVEANLPEAKRVIAWLESKLRGERYWIQQRFTLADAYLIPVLDYLSQMPEPFNLMQHSANIQAYLQFQQAQAYCDGVLNEV